MKLSSMLFAASLFALPAVSAVAQGNAASSGNSGSTSTQSSAGAMDPHTPGATGDTIVKGDRSTISGDAKATAEQRTNEGSR